MPGAVLFIAVLGPGAVGPRQATGEDRGGGRCGGIRRAGRRVAGGGARIMRQTLDGRLRGLALRLGSLSGRLRNFGL